MLKKVHPSFQSLSQKFVFEGQMSLIEIQAHHQQPEYMEQFHLEACSNKHQSCNKINKLHPPFLLQHQYSFACALNNKTTSYKSCSSCSEEKSPLVTVSLTPNNTLNTKTIGRMTCLCFLGPIMRDLTSCSYTTQLQRLLKRSLQDQEGINSFMDLCAKNQSFCIIILTQAHFDSVTCAFNI